MSWCVVKEKDHMEVLRTAILQMIKQKKGLSFYSQEVIQQLFPEDWEIFLPELKETLFQLESEGLLCLESEGDKVVPKKLTKRTKIP